MRAEMTGDIYLVIGDELRDVYLRWIGDVSRKKKILCVILCFFILSSFLINYFIVVYIRDFLEN